MNREIKFRAWDTFNERMVDEPYRFRPSTEHDLGFAKEDKRYDAPFQFYESWQDEDDGINRPCFIMQFTGLKDKHGTEIYEGDVLDFTFDGVVFIKNPTYVVFEQGAFLVNKKNFKPLVSDCENISIVGNIFQHPELIK